MFVTLWEYEVKQGSEELFEKTYGPEGEWVRLFRRDARYRGTRLQKAVGRERIYVTIDEWESREAYEEFRAEHTAEYAEIDRRCEGMTVREPKRASSSVRHHEYVTETFSMWVDLVCRSNRRTSPSHS